MHSIPPLCSKGITKWEVVLPPLCLPGDGTFCRSDSCRMESVSFTYLSLQDIFRTQPALPLLSVSNTSTHPLLLIQMFSGVVVYTIDLWDFMGEIQSFQQESMWSWISCEGERFPSQILHQVQVGRTNLPCWPTESWLVWKWLLCEIWIMHLFAHEILFYIKDTDKAVLLCFGWFIYLNVQLF